MIYNQQIGNLYRQKVVRHGNGHIRDTERQRRVSNFLSSMYVNWKALCSQLSITNELAAFICKSEIDKVTPVFRK
jgi:hypothetical protein